MEDIVEADTCFQMGVDDLLYHLHSFYDSPTPQVLVFPFGMRTKIVHPRSVSIYLF